LGSGNTIPQLFEFDTGSAGFFAAYASDDPSASPWWGSAGVVSTGTDAHKKFDSGTDYKGVEAVTSVSFYSSAADVRPVLSTGGVKVGQIDDITDGNGDKLWDQDGITSHDKGSPPIDGQFYGDFGVAPNYEGNGITSVLNELTFARGVQAGFRIDYEPPTGTEVNGTWTLQIGLTDDDTEDPAGAYFAMTPDTTAPGGATSPRSGTRFFSQQLFVATVHVAVPGTPISDVAVGITPDTGADTTVHNTDRSSQSSAATYAGITDFNSDGKTGQLYSGLPFSLSGADLSGTPVVFFSETTDDAQAYGVWVNVQNGTSAKEIYYVNTGIQLFFQNDVVYDMRRGRVGLIPAASN